MDLVSWQSREYALGFTLPYHYINRKKTLFFGDFAHIPNVMEKEFLFVDGKAVDKTIRKSIRSHVMIGKNAGKTHQRSSKFDTTRQGPLDKKRTFKHCSFISKERNPKLIETIFCPIANHRILGNSFLSLSFPLPLTPHTLKVINQHYFYVIERLYPCQLGISVEEFKHAWLQVMLTDDAACYCSIATLESTNEFFISGGISSPKALHHLSRSLALLKQRLDSEDALSDSTLAIIIMLIIQEQMRIGPQASEIHYNGLKRLIDLRGGLGQFERNPILLLKICKIDICYALQTGKSISFSRNRLHEVQSKLVCKGIIFDEMPAMLHVNHHNLNPYLHEILVDASRMASLFKNMPAGESLDIYTYLELIISISSRLIQFQPLQSSEQLPAIDAAYHLGLTIFIMTFFLQHDSRRMLQFELISTRVRSIIERDLGDLDDDFALWFLFMGGIWIGFSSSGSFITTRVQGLTRKLCINDWTELKRIFDMFPWMERLHDQPGCALWNMIHLSPHMISSN